MVLFTVETSKETKIADTESKLEPANTELIPWLSGIRKLTLSAESPMLEKVGTYNFEGVSIGMWSKSNW